jgi:dTDP-4-amino-4,6-dideoxygalactose transaminase
MLKLFKPFISQTARENVQRVLNSDSITEGEEVKLFETELEQKLGKKCLTVNSGTSALELAYELAGIKEGDEVITPVLTCTATNLPLVRRKAKIIFADTDYDLNINIQDVQNKITNKTKAIVFVHFGGHNRGLADLVAICRKRNITLIEDAAQAIGSNYWGQGDFAAVSLQAIKTITAGDGGLLICKRDEDYKKAKRLRWFGIDRDDRSRDMTEAGYKYHMNNINAAIGRGNLMYMGELMNHIHALGEVYRSYGLFSYAWLAGGFTENYDKLKEALNEEGYECDQHHYRNDKYKIFGERQNLPIMDSIENKYFFVPLHYGVSLEVAHKIGKICQKYVY